MPEGRRSARGGHGISHVRDYGFGVGHSRDSTDGRHFRGDQVVGDGAGWSVATSLSGQRPMRAWRLLSMSMSTVTRLSAMVSLRRRRWPGFGRRYKRLSADRLTQQADADGLAATHVGVNGRPVPTRRLTHLVRDGGVSAFAYVAGDAIVVESEGPAGVERVGVRVINRTAGVRVEAIGGEGHQFRSRRQIPVGVGGADVSQIGGQDADAFIDVDPGSLPVDEGAHSKAVPQIVVMPTSA